MKKQAKWNSGNIRTLTLAALLFASSIVLSIVEGMIPLSVGIPGVRLGLSNVPVMYALFFMSKKEALTIAALKSLFVVITRGFVAGLLSFCGGWLSVLVMALLLFFFKERISYLLLSIAGAIFHNIGQLLAVSLLYTSLYLWIYLPVLFVAGIIAGSATAVLLKLILPAFQKLDLK